VDKVKAQKPEEGGVMAENTEQSGKEVGLSLDEQAVKDAQELDRIYHALPDWARTMTSADGVGLDLHEKIDSAFKNTQDVVQFLIKENEEFKKKDAAFIAWLCERLQEDLSEAYYKFLIAKRSGVQVKADELTQCERLDRPSQQGWWWWLPECFKDRGDNPAYWSIVPDGPDTERTGEFVGPLDAPVGVSNEQA